MLYYSRFHRPLQNSTETGKFRGSAQNSAYCGKLWSLVILLRHCYCPVQKEHCAAFKLFAEHLSYKCNFHQVTTVIHSAQKPNRPKRRL